MTRQEWQMIRAKIRYDVEHHGVFTAPLQLRAHIEKIPDDYAIWEEYAQEITRLRRNTITSQKRARVRRRTKAAQAYHRDYQKDYMKDYRAGHRRRGPKDMPR